MNEWEKAQKGMLYDANYDKNILKLRDKCADLCFEFNNLEPSDKENQNKLKALRDNAKRFKMVL